VTGEESTGEESTKGRKPKGKAGLIDKLEKYLSSLKTLEGLIDESQPRSNSLMGSQFMRNRLLHQVRDLQKSLQRYLYQLQQEEA
jgi:hypothetical protein